MINDNPPILQVLSNTGTVDVVLNTIVCGGDDFVSSDCTFTGITLPMTLSAGGTVNPDSFL